MYKIQARYDLDVTDDEVREFHAAIRAVDSQATIVPESPQKPRVSTILTTFRNDHKDEMRALFMNWRSSRQRRVPAQFIFVPNDAGGDEHYEIA